MKEAIFDCGRTCEFLEACRFSPALSTFRLVHSHTTKIAVEFRDPRGLKAAVEAMGGQWLGLGSHLLYSSAEQGHGFRLPGWSYPLVLKDNGDLAYDDFNGNWGKVSDLDTLKGTYAIAAAQIAAQGQGWYTEIVRGELVIHHPDGGTLTVQTDGTIDAMCFTGRNCEEAARPIEEALGKKIESNRKPEFYAEKQTLKNGEN